MTSEGSRTDWKRKFGAAFHGIRSSWSSEPSLTVHLICTPVVLGIAALSRLQPLQWAAIILAIGLVITAELLNTAVETVVDMVSPNYSEQARMAKDVAAGAVLVAAITAILVGLCVFIPAWWPATVIETTKPV